MEKSLLTSFQKADRQSSVHIASNGFRSRTAMQFATTAVLLNAASSYAKPDQRADPEHVMNAEKSSSRGSLRSETESAGSVQIRVLPERGAGTNRSLLHAQRLPKRIAPGRPPGSLSIRAVRKIRVGKAAPKLRAPERKRTAECFVD
jgi:hypothetical protein